MESNYMSLAKFENDDTPIQIFQMTDQNLMLPQGDFTKFENGNLIKEFLQLPKVKIYFNEIFMPNKSIKEFHYEKIKGIYNDIKPLIDKLSDNTGLPFIIPDYNYEISMISNDIKCTPSTVEDLDNYMPIFFLEWAIYPKSFVKKTKLKSIILVHDIKFYNHFSHKDKPQSRAGCPETSQAEALILSTAERNFAYMRIVIHHELFHYLDWADDNDYSDPEWNKLNVKGFKYGKGGEFEREWIQLDKQIHGFINHYSMSALEEDRAEIYQYLIGCPDEALNHKDEIVKRKAKRIRQVISEFDEEGVGNIDNLWWANLIDYRNKFPYKEHVFRGHVHNLQEEKE